MARMFTPRVKKFRSSPTSSFSCSFIFTVGTSKTSKTENNSRNLSVLSETYELGDIAGEFPQ